MCRQGRLPLTITISPYIQGIAHKHHKYTVVLIKRECHKILEKSLFHILVASLSLVFVFSYFSIKKFDQKRVDSLFLTCVNDTMATKSLPVSLTCTSNQNVKTVCWHLIEKILSICVLANELAFIFSVKMYNCPVPVSHKKTLLMQFKKKSEPQHQDFKKLMLLTLSLLTKFKR